MSLTSSPSPLANSFLSSPVLPMDSSLVKSKYDFFVQKRQTASSNLPYVVFVITVIEPYYKLREYFQSPCTGTQVGKDLVLTTASCLITHSYDIPEPETITVVENNKKLEVRKVFIHPEYINNDDFDFAVIVTDKSIQQHFPKLPKAVQDFENIKYSCALSGFGDSKRDTNPPLKTLLLNETSLTVLRCRETTGELKHVCLHFDDLIPCPGDVGSPLICDNELFALYTPRLSSELRSAKCIDRYNTLFTPLLPVMAWLDRIVTVPSNALEVLNNPLNILLLCGSVLAVIGGIYYCLVEFLQKTFSPLVDEEPTPEENQTTLDSSHDVTRAPLWNV